MISSNRLACTDMRSNGKSENTLLFFQLMKLTLLQGRRLHCMGCSLVVTWKEQVAKWNSTLTHLQACAHAHQLQVCEAILSRLWIPSSVLPVPLAACAAIWDSSCYHNKLLSPKIWNCSAPSGGWWCTWSWNSPQLASMCGCLHGLGLGAVVSVFRKDSKQCLPCWSLPNPNKRHFAKHIFRNYIVDKSQLISGIDKTQSFSTDLRPQPQYLLLNIRTLPALVLQCY